MPPPSRDVRRVAFGRFVARVLDEARARGMSVTDIEKATGVGKTTFYRWRDGDWTRDPRGTQVRAFCDGLGVPADAAYKVLGWADDAGRAQPEPPIDPDVRPILRMLADPNVPEPEKAYIRETLRRLVRPQHRRTG